MREKCILTKEKVKIVKEEEKEEEEIVDKFAEDEIIDISNLGCAPEEATKMFKEEVGKDKDYLIKAMKLAVEGNTNDPGEMRETICSIMLSMPEVYSKEFLGMEPAGYVQWLLKGNKASGGAPEIRMMSRFYEVECVVVHMRDLRVETFGTD